MSAKVRLIRYRWKMRLKYPILTILMAVAACYAIALVGCKSITLETPSIVAPPAPLAWEGKSSDAAAWSDHLRLEVGASRLPILQADGIEDLCPMYELLGPSDRAEVWAQVISAMTKYESSFNPKAKYVEPDIRDAHGNHVVSSGLLQISVESARAYACDVTASSLFDAKVNLACGVKILEKLVQRSGRAIGKDSAGKWRGGSAYWAVLRPTKGVEPRASYAGIRTYVRSLPPCRK